MGQRVMQVTGDRIVQFFSGEPHYRVKSDGLPEDTRIIDVKLIKSGPDRREIVEYLLESDEWEGGETGPAPLIEPNGVDLRPHPSGSKVWEPI